MTETEIKQILENLDEQDLETLEKYYYEYQRKTTTIQKLEDNLYNFKKERQKEIYPSQKELDIMKTIKLIKNLPMTRKHKVKGTLNDYEYIKELSIDGKSINPDLLQNKEYTKLFFKKAGNYIPNAVIFLLISMAIYGIGSVSDMLLLQLLSLVTLFPSIMNMLDAITNNTLETTSKTKVSQKTINILNKKLYRDYEKEHQHTENMHLQNLAFLDSKEDIFEKMLERYRKDLEELVVQIREILKSDKENIILTKEEQIDAQTIISKGHQKVLKK